MHYYNLLYLQLNSFQEKIQNTTYYEMLTSYFGIDDDINIFILLYLQSCDL